MADSRSNQVKYRAKFQKGTNQLYFAPYYFFRTDEQGTHTPVDIGKAFDSKLAKSGDGKNVTVGAITATTANKPSLNAGEKLSVLFGKIARWFAQLKALAFKDKVSPGDVNAGSYGIDISGNATTATGPGDTSESSIESGDSLVIRKTDNRFSRVAFLDQASHLALTKDGQWRPIPSLAQLMAIQRLLSENVYNFRIPYASYADDSTLATLEFGNGSTNMRGKFILSANYNGNIVLSFDRNAGINDLLDGGMIQSTVHSAYRIYEESSVNVQVNTTAEAQDLGRSGTKAIATIPKSPYYSTYGHVVMECMAMTAIDAGMKQILITVDLNYERRPNRTETFVYGKAKVENLYGFEP